MRAIVFISIFFISGCSYVKATSNYLCEDEIDGPLFSLQLVGCSALEITYIGLKLTDYVSSAYRTVPLIIVNQGVSLTPLHGENGSKFGIHGNWCGPGRPSKGKHPRPVDSLDRACMKHDLCYAKYGYNRCMCDRQFAKNILNGKTPLQANLSPLEWSMYNYFSTSGCN